MAARYIHISEEEFDKFARSKSFLRTEDPNLYAQEIIYERRARHGMARMLIYSTISTFGGGGRKVGKDAIRLVLQVKRNEEWGGVGWKAKRVHRTKNWRANLTSRMHDAADMVHNDTCPLCGHAMIRRTGKHVDFFGCVMFSSTGCNGSADER